MKHDHLPRQAPGGHQENWKEQETEREIETETETEREIETAREKGFASQAFLCLTRACLDKLIVFTVKSRKKGRSFWFLVGAEAMRWVSADGKGSMRVASLDAGAATPCYLPPPQSPPVSTHLMPRQALDRMHNIRAKEVDKTMAGGAPGLLCYGEPTAFPTPFGARRVCNIHNVSLCLGVCQDRLRTEFAKTG